MKGPNPHINAIGVSRSHDRRRDEYVPYYSQLLDRISCLTLKGKA
jgi:hypothetical protein